MQPLEKPHGRGQAPKIFSFHRGPPYDLWPPYKKFPHGGGVWPPSLPPQRRGLVPWPTLFAASSSFSFVPCILIRHRRQTGGRGLQHGGMRLRVSAHSARWCRSLRVSWRGRRRQFPSPPGCPPTPPSETPSYPSSPDPSSHQTFASSPSRSFSQVFPQEFCFVSQPLDVDWTETKGVRSQGGVPPGTCRAPYKITRGDPYDFWVCSSPPRNQIRL